MLSDTQFWIMWTTFVFLVVFNFMPACVAFVSNHPERWLLTWLNVLSLFSIVLWVALMVWAAGGKRDDSVINRFIGSRQNRRILVLGAVAVVAIGVGSTLYSLNIA
jgi:hypothetical protein